MQVSESIVALNLRVYVTKVQDGVITVVGKNSKKKLFLIKKRKLIFVRWDRDLDLNVP